MQPAAVRAERRLHVFLIVGHDISGGGGRERPGFLVHFFAERGRRARGRAGQRVIARQHNDNRHEGKSSHGSHPPSAMVMPTRINPRTTIEAPNSHGWRPVIRPKAYPVKNSITMATALETRRAGPAWRMNMNGTTTGNVQR